MARFTSGWVKVYRELLGSDIASHPTRLSLFIHLVAMANLEETWVDWKGKPRICPRGSLVTSLRELAQVTGADRGMIERQLKYLALRDTLVVESETRGSFITIKNYSEYQDNQTVDVTKVRRGSDTDTATHAATDTASIEEINNIRTKEERNNTSAEPSNLVPLKPAVSNALVRISSEKQVAISADLIKSWADTYPKDFLDMELKKARSWILANPQKSPKKGWGRFFNSWFDRGWEKYRTTLKSNPSAISVDDLNDLLGAS